MEKPAEEQDEVRPEVGPVEKFCVFPKLPVEIQLEIWKYAMLGPQRVVSLEELLLPGSPAVGAAFITVLYGWRILLRIQADSALLQIKVFPFAPNSLYDPGYVFEDTEDPLKIAMELESVDLGTVTFSSDAELCPLLSISRDEALKAFPGCMNLGDGKIIHFDPDQDKVMVIPLTEHRIPAFPGFYRLDSNKPDYQKMFQDVKHLLLSPNNDPCSLAHVRNNTLKFLAPFTALETLSLVSVLLEKIRLPLRLVSLEAYLASTCSILEEIVRVTRSLKHYEQRWPSRLSNVQGDYDARDWSELKVS
ncbi:uncharacterized protein RSE6_12585 [Rhynchosporium secalis]|uniref:2EXR domain-containing protein n=1 Tax=Rhynchosporium secalis TaxID=38038 RepID=A0A1E1MQR8_RHYSE|nr:uncharacterized protein RSE6_12585 [Rhynchosporium secalis]